jgi:hypothetical protein
MSVFAVRRESVFCVAGAHNQMPTKIAIASEVGE